MNCLLFGDRINHYEVKHVIQIGRFHCNNYIWKLYTAARDEVKDVSVGTRMYVHADRE